MSKGATRLRKGGHAAHPLDVRVWVCGADVVYEGHVRKQASVFLWLSCFSLLLFSHPSPHIDFTNATALPVLLFSSTPP